MDPFQADFLARVRSRACLSQTDDWAALTHEQFRTLFGEEPLTVALLDDGDSRGVAIAVARSGFRIVLTGTELGLRLVASCSRCDTDVVSSRFVDASSLPAQLAERVYALCDSCERRAWTLGRRGG